MQDTLDRYVRPERTTATYVPLGGTERSQEDEEARADRLRQIEEGIAQTLRELGANTDEEVGALPLLEPVVSKAPSGRQCRAHASESPPADGANAIVAVMAACALAALGALAYAVSLGFIP